MDLKELGQLARRSETLRTKYTDEELDFLPDRALGLRVLEAYPEYWDSISPSAQRIAEIMTRNPEPSYAFFASTATRIRDRAAIIANNLAEATSVYKMEQMIQASALGVPVEYLGEYKLEILQQEHRKEIMRYEAYLKLLEIKVTTEAEVWKQERLHAMSMGTLELTANLTKELELSKLLNTQALELSRLDNELREQDEAMERKYKELRLGRDADLADAKNEARIRKIRRASRP